MATTTYGYFTWCLSRITDAGGLAIPLLQITSNLSLMDEMYYQKIQKYDVPAVREHMIRVTGASEVKFGALILAWVTRPQI